MKYRSRTIALLAVCGLVTGVLGAGEVAAQVPSAPALTAVVPAPSFTLDWTRATSSHTSDSSPVVVDNLGNPFIAVGSKTGDLRAFDLDSGTPMPGWGALNAGGGAANRPSVRAPLSTDGKFVYVPVAVNGKDAYPLWRKYSASGALQWSSNPSMVIPPTGGFLLSGLSIARIDNQIRGFGGSSGHWIFGVDANNRGGQMWGFRNADSTMATPALADLYGTGRPQVITSSDTTAEFAGDRNGGIFRILTDKGAQICSATQLVSGNTYANSGYNNSSPAVAEVAGQPLIVFGSTGPTQYGVGGNQLVGYDAECRLKWATTDLGGQASASPTFADVLGTGRPQIIELISIASGTAKYPRIIVIDPVTGGILANTGTALAPYAANIAYTQGTSVATADFNADGAQDMVVPAKQGQFLVLNGRTRAVLATIPTNLVVQNTPVITQEPNGLRVTVAGYNGYGGAVSSYTSPGGTLGAIGWPKFGQNPGLTGLQGRLAGPYNQILEGNTLASGRTIRSVNGAYFAAMQKDGNFVLYTAAGKAKWWTRTNVPGSKLVVRPDGNVQVVAPDGTVKWQSRVTGVGVERLTLGDDGKLKVNSGTWTATRRLTAVKAIWSVG